MFRTILSAVFIFMVLYGTAQSTITGVVQDVTNNQTLPGVTIYTNISRSP